MKKSGGTCEFCTNYVYDEEYETYECQVSMDEDDLVRLRSSRRTSCPYYQSDDEYRIVRKQM